MVSAVVLAVEAGNSPGLRRSATCGSGKKDGKDVAVIDVDDIDVSKLDLGCK